MASAASQSQRSKKVVVQLRCSDGKEINLDEATASMSGYVSRQLRRWRILKDSEGVGVRIKLSENERLTHMPSDLVEKVFRYCRRHAHAKPGEDLDAFDAQFLNVDYPELCKLVKAALGFDIDPLWHRSFAALDKMASAGVEGVHPSIIMDVLALPF